MFCFLRHNICSPNPDTDRWSNAALILGGIRVLMFLGFMNTIPSIVLSLQQTCVVVAQTFTEIRIGRLFGLTMQG